MGEKRIFVGNPGFNPGQRRAHPKISFPSLHQLFTFVFYWLGQGSAFGHFDQDLSAGSCFLHERQSFSLKAWVLKYGECTGCSSWQQGTSPGLGQQQQAWAGAAGSHWCKPRLGHPRAPVALPGQVAAAGRASRQWGFPGKFSLFAAGAEESCVNVQLSRVAGPVQASVPACVCPLALCDLPIKWVLTKKHRVVITEG